MTIAYCISDFQSQARIIKIDRDTGDWTIQASWRLPGAVLGCAALHEPVCSLDVNNGNLFQDWTSYADDFFSLNLTTGEYVTSTRSKDIFFYGFTSFVFDYATGEAVGATGTVENNGYCNSGCFAVGRLNANTGVYRQLSTIPYRAIMSVAAFYDQGKNSFDYFLQGSYPLTSEAYCGRSQTDQCLIRVDGQTGEVISSIFTPEVTIYKYGHSIHDDGSIRVFGNFGVNGYGFGNLNITSGNIVGDVQYIRPTSIEYKASTSSFSSSESYLVHASGNQYKPDPQLLILDAITGETLVDSNLEGLAEELRAEYDWIFVWSVDFVPR